MPAGSLYIHYIIKTNVVRDYNYWARYASECIIYIIVEPAEIFVPEQLTGCVNNFIFSILKSHEESFHREGIIHENAKRNVLTHTHTHAHAEMTMCRTKYLFKCLMSCNNNNNNNIYSNYTFYCTRILLGYCIRAEIISLSHNMIKLC